MIDLFFLSIYILDSHVDPGTSLYEAINKASKPSSKTAVSVRVGVKHNWVLKATSRPSFKPLGGTIERSDKSRTAITTTYRRSLPRSPPKDPCLRDETIRESLVQTLIVFRYFLGSSPGPFNVRDIHALEMLRNI